MTPSGFVCGYHLFKTAASLLRVPLWMTSAECMRVCIVGL